MKTFENYFKLDVCFVYKASLTFSSSKMASFACIKLLKCYTVITCSAICVEMHKKSQTTTNVLVTWINCLFMIHVIPVIVSITYWSLLCHILRYKNIFFLKVPLSQYRTDCKMCNISINKNIPYKNRFVY